MVVFDPFQPISCRSASNNLKLEALSSKIHPYGQKVDKLGIQSLVSWLSKNNKKNFSKSIRFFLVSSSNGLMMIFASMVPCDEIPLPLTLLERNPNNSIHSRYSFLTGNIHGICQLQILNILGTNVHKFVTEEQFPITKSWLLGFASYTIISTSWELLGNSTWWELK